MCTVISILFIIGKCNLLWEGLTCDTRSQHLNCYNPLWLPLLSSVFSVRKVVVLITMCLCPCWCWAQRMAVFLEVCGSVWEWISSRQLDFQYSRELTSLICFWQQGDFFFLPVQFPKVAWLQAMWQDGAGGSTSHCPCVKPTWDARNSDMTIWGFGFFSFKGVEDGFVIKTLYWDLGDLGSVLLWTLHVTLNQTRCWNIQFWGL